MAVGLVDVFQLQLAQQAALYTLTNMSGRKKSAERVAGFFLRAQQLLPVTATLEIGAHEAGFSRKVKQRNPERTVRAFEANPHVFAHFLLEGSVRKAGIDYEHYAVGEADGSALFYIYDTLNGEEEAHDSRRQSMLPRVETEGMHFTTVRVPMARLDSLCANDSPDSRYALWIDAEGSSAQVLAGAEKTLQKTLILIIELESRRKFAGQADDREIMATLLARDFVPILRDFQFRHQYNALFVRKDSLPLVEHEWHRYMQAALHHELQASFMLEAIPRQNTPVAPPPLPRLRFAGIRELQEGMAELPLLRAPRTGMDPRRTVVACHISDLDEAVAFYRQQLRSLPAFYVLGLPADGPGGGYADIAVHDFAALAPGMDAQLYFRQAKAPRLSPFIQLAKSMRELGIDRYGLERRGTEQLYGRSTRAALTDEAWDTVLNFVNVLGDADSQYAYMAVCRSRLEAEPGYIPLAGYEQYFHPKVSVEPGDIVCEGGIDNGKSTLHFFEAMQRKGRIYAFEPVPASCEKLQSVFAPFAGICLERHALWNHTGALLLSGMESSNSAVTRESGPEKANCSCTSVDDYFMDMQPPTVIKLDVEGAEPEVLEGARKTITTHVPKLMISIYHGQRGPDWIGIPAMMMEYAPRYQLFCGHHRPWYAESIVYAVGSRQ